MIHRRPDVPEEPGQPTGLSCQPVADPYSGQFNVWPSSVASLATLESLTVPVGRVLGVVTIDFTPNDDGNKQDNVQYVSLVAFIRSRHLPSVTALGQAPWRAGKTPRSRLPTGRYGVSKRSSAIARDRACAPWRVTYTGKAPLNEDTENAFLRIVIAWESFLSEWLISVVVRDPTTLGAKFHPRGLRGRPHADDVERAESLVEVASIIGVSVVD